MSVKLEARAYGPESTPAERQAIKDRVSVYRDNLIMYREVPIQSIFQLDLFEEKLNELGASLDQYDLLIDLTEAGAPSAQIRARLKEVFSHQKKLRRTAVFTGKNFMLNVAAKFVLTGAGLKSITVDKTLEQALTALQK